VRPVRNGPVLRVAHGVGLALFVVSVALLAACGSARLAATTGAAAPPTRPEVGETTKAADRASEVRAATTTTATAPPATSAPATSASAPSSCAQRELRASIDVQPAAAAAQALNRTEALIVLTDLSASACTVDGFAEIDAVDGGVAKSLVIGDVDQDGPPGAVVLGSGDSAFAGIEWTSDPTCPDVTSFLLTPPSGSSALPVDVVVPDGLQLPLDVCSAGIELGPFATTSEGTLSWP
jgi:hypothetical protein